MLTFPIWALLIFPTVGMHRTDEQVLTVTIPMIVLAVLASRILFGGGVYMRQWYKPIGVVA